MKINILKSCSTVSGIFPKDSIVNLSDKTALALVNSGFAEIAKVEEPKADQPKARGRRK